MTHVTGNLPDYSKYDAFVAKMKADMDSKYKYMIEGKHDPIFQSLSGIITDQSQLGIVKARRINLARTIKALNGDPQTNDQKMLAAKARVDFVKNTIADIKKVSKEAAPSSVAATIRVLSAELETAVGLYSAARLASGNGTGDTAFKQSVNTAITALRPQIHTQKERLVGEGVYFHAGLYKSLHGFDKIATQLQAF